MNVSGQAPFNPDFDATTGITTRDILWTFLPRIPSCEIGGNHSALSLNRIGCRRSHGRKRQWRA
jgi:hypothetical protein